MSFPLRAGFFLGLLILSILGTTASSAATPKDYSYMFLQGKISESKGGLPVAGTSVRLSSNSDSFEVITDERGVFLFEKLPVASYDLRVTTPDGRVIRGVQQGQLFKPGGARFRLWLNEKGADQSIRIETIDERVDLVAPKRMKWNRLWKELAIFVALGGLLAL